MIFLAGCTSKSQIVRYKEVSPLLLAACNIPEMQGDTWGHLAEAYLERGISLEECNSRLEAVRKLQDNKESDQ